MNGIQGVVIREAYKDYKPHINVFKVVKHMVAAVPEKRLVGLKTVVLTNSGNLNHDMRRGKTWSRRRKVHVRKCFGLYHRKTAQSGAWVEIFVDNILSYWPRPLHYIPLLRDLFIAEPLYHEIGHHIHWTQRPQNKEPEDVADQWKRGLMYSYFKSRHRYLIPLAWIVKAIQKPGRKANTTPDG